MSGFQYAPGTPRRRVADKHWIELHRTATVKNPRRYNHDSARAFGIVHAVGSSWFVEMRDSEQKSEPFDSLDELLDAGWTVD